MIPLDNRPVGVSNSATPSMPTSEGVSDFSIPSDEGLSQTPTPSREQIINSIRMEAEGVTAAGVPLDIFPTKLQGIILDWIQHDGFLPEYVMAAVLMASATAIGNAVKLNVKGSWYANPALYTVFVGRPGVGKTHPITAAFAPLRAVDAAMLETYRREKAEYADKVKDDRSIFKPKLQRIISSDTTPEALMTNHANTPRGVCLLSDEVVSLIKSANRYNPGILYEILPSAWSQGTLVVSRKGSDAQAHPSPDLERHEYLQSCPCRIGARPRPSSCRL